MIVPAKKNKKIDYLESLRGVAALVVVIGHFMVGFYPALWWARPEQVHTRSSLELYIAQTPLNLIYNGSFSVSIFFVLSGFVLTYKFFKDRSSSIALVPIAFKRYTRLLFPIVLSSFIAYLILKLSLFFNQPAAVFTKSGWLDAYWKFEPSFFHMIYESFVGVFFTRNVTYNNVLWTMRYEFYGSMIVYVCIALFGRHKRRDWFYAATIIIFRRSFYLAFILGMILSDFVTREQSIFKKIRNKNVYIALLLVGLFFGSYHVDGLSGRGVYAFLHLGTFAKPRTYEIIGATMVLIALLNSRRLQNLFSKRPFLFLGRISFSIYVLHFITIGSLASFIFLRMIPAASYHVSFLVTFALCLPFLFLVSHYAYRFVDSKGIQASQTVYKTLLGWMKTSIHFLDRIIPAPLMNARIIALFFYPDRVREKRKARLQA